MYNEENLRFRDHDVEDLSHYSVATADIDFKYPWGFDELWGIADRTDYDLRQHMEHSKVNMEYHDPETNEKYVPYCVEPSVGVERLMLALMVQAYDEEVLENEDTRIVMRFEPHVAPVTCAVLPLSKKLAEPAEAILHDLMKEFATDYDESASIGKRYRRQDAIGTPFCITVDFDTLEDGTVTLRERDSMEQHRFTMDEAKAFMRNALKG